MAFCVLCQKSNNVENGSLYIFSWNSKHSKCVHTYDFFACSMLRKDAKNYWEQNPKPSTKTEVNIMANRKRKMDVIKANVDIILDVPKRRNREQDIE